ncbi:MAG: hypothetical protein NTV33_07370 [Coprothermobacterota bacterium]|jgi:hypothetical protein|nr:hypothetical protein [Coprothermobacterota bacterium]
MGRLQQALIAYPLIGVDTSIFICHLEGNPRYRDLVQEVLAGVEEGKWAAVIAGCGS